MLTIDAQHNETGSAGRGCRALRACASVAVFWLAHFSLTPFAVSQESQSGFQHASMHEGFAGDCYRASGQPQNQLAEISHKTCLLGVAQKILEKATGTAPVRVLGEAVAYPRPPPRGRAFGTCTGLCAAGFAHRWQAGGGQGGTWRKKS